MSKPAPCSSATGSQSPNLNYDDLAGQDVKGKIVVFVTGGPADMPGPIKAHYQSGEERRKALAKAGVIGTISIRIPRAAEVPWSRIAAITLPAKHGTARPWSDVPPPLQVSITFNPTHAEMLFAGSGHTFQEVLAALNADKPLPHFPLAVKVRARLGMTRSEVKSENVVGVLPGSDPAPQERIRRGQRAPRPSRNRRARQRRPHLQRRDGRRLRRRIADRNRPCDERFRSKAEALDSLPLRHGRREGRARLSIFCCASHRAPAPSSPTSTWTCTFHSSR